MNYEVARISKIVNELTNFCLRIGAQHMKIDLKDTEDKTELVVQCDTKGRVEEYIEDLKASLASPRQEQVEEYLWEMVGESESYDKLNLVGMMLDHSDISYEGNKLVVRVYRKKT